MSENVRRASAIVALWNEDGDQLLLGYNLIRHGWELPGGRIRIGEDPLEAAKRELLEEAGCTGQDWEFEGYVSGVPDWVSLLFTATVLKAPSPLVVKEPEVHRDWAWFDHLPENDMSSVMEIVAREYPDFLPERSI